MLSQYQFYDLFRLHNPESFSQNEMKETIPHQIYIFLIFYNYKLNNYICAKIYLD